VAAKAMPANSVVLGVDLLPIRPIRNVKTLVSDITTAECRSLIKKEIPSGWCVAAPLFVFLREAEFVTSIMLAQFLSRSSFSS